MASAWNSENGCLNCWDDSVDLPKDNIESWPTILIAIFVDGPTPFLEEFFIKIHEQSYPKSKLHLFVHNAADYHEKLVDEFVEKHGPEYRSIKRIMADDKIVTSTARNLAM